MCQKLLESFWVFLNPYENETVDKEAVTELLSLLMTNVTSMTE